MKNKIFQILFIILFITIFSLKYSSEYIEFHEKNFQLIKENKKLEQQIKEFNFDKIEYLDNTYLIYWPDENPLNIIIEKINNAKEKIYLEIYMLSEKSILNSIINAKNKNIDIKIILEKSPYMTTSFNNITYELLKQNNISVIWSNPDNFSLNHSKLLIIDDEVIISTWNFTYSSFEENREFYVSLIDKNSVNLLKKIFINDFDWKNNIFYNENIILSPNYSRNKLEYLIKNAKENIDMYFPYLEDENFKKLLINKSKIWININLIVDKDIEKNNIYKDLKNSQINIVKLTKNSLHAKAILIDNKYLYIWSINFSTYSLDKNREIGILIKNKNIIDKFKKIYMEDLK